MQVTASGERTAHGQGFKRWLGRTLAVATAFLCLFATSASPASADDPDGVFEILEGSFFAKAHPGPLTTTQTYGSAGIPSLGALRAAAVAAPEVSQAGAHPDGVTGFGLDYGPPGGPADAPARDIVVETPPGFLGNVTAVPSCPMRLFLRIEQGPPRRADCPIESQVGTAAVLVPGWILIDPVFKLEGNSHTPVRFGYRTFNGETIVLNVEVRTDSDYGLRVTAPNLPTQTTIIDSVVDIWGVPWRSVNNGRRVIPFSAHPREIRPFLINPMNCDAGRLTTKISANQWMLPDDWATASTLSENPPTGCDKLEFGTVRAPVSLDLRPDASSAGAPTGLKAELRLPYNDDPNGLARPPLRDARVELPEGLIINPSAGDGLAACSEQEAGWESTRAPRCPEASKIGSAKVVTPLLEEPLDGGVYLAEPYENPTGSFMAMYITASLQGIEAKVAGRVERDPQTGRLTAVFEDNPQVLFTEMDLRFKSGNRAPLVSPDRCGEFETVSSLEPWSAPYSGPAVRSTSRFVVNMGFHGGACETGPKGFAPQFAAGTESSQAAGSSAFTLNMSRPDGQQEIKNITQVKLPKGLVGDVGSVPLCVEAQAAVGACGAESRLGHVQVAAGAGPTPLWVPQPGKAPTGVYLTGPYAGAPYGLSIVVPAQAGPFDLGKVVVRSALHVDEWTAEITSGVDEVRLIDPKGAVTEFGADIPRILEGIVLNQREIRVIVDREGFMINPTNCSQQQITTQLHGFEGGFSQVGTNFRASDCARLGFAPRFRARILDRGRRSTLRSWNPRTRFTVVPRPGDANIGGARVALPSSTILDQSNLDTTCTRAQMAAEDCPAGSIVGYAKAWSPILRRPVEGPVYLAANGGVRPLPDIIAVLDGEVRVSLLGEISTLRTRGRARLQNTFRVVPDAPVNRFVLTMRGGRNTGLLVNSTDLCRTNERGVSVFHGQNGRVDRSNLRVGLTFRGCRKVRRQAARRAAKRKAARKSAVRRIARKAALAREVR